MTFVALWCLLEYEVCSTMMFVADAVCRQLWRVSLIGFVAVSQNQCLNPGPFVQPDAWGELCEWKPCPDLKNISTTGGLVVKIFASGAEVSLAARVRSPVGVKVGYRHRIVNDRTENYGAYIVIISK